MNVRFKVNDIVRKSSSNTWYRVIDVYINDTKWRMDVQDLNNTHIQKDESQFDYVQVLHEEIQAV